MLNAEDLQSGKTRHSGFHETGRDFEETGDEITSWHAITVLSSESSKSKSSNNLIFVHQSRGSDSMHQPPSSYCGVCLNTTPKRVVTKALRNMVHFIQVMTSNCPKAR